MSRRAIIGLSVAGLVATIILGIIVAQRITVGPETLQSDDTVRITEAVIGTPTSEGGDQAQLLSRLRQKPDYDPTDRIALRVTADIPSGETTDLSVRLRDTAGVIKQLSPSTITVRDGTSGYCCWVIGEAGEYILQISRPSGPLSSIPLSVRAGRREPLRIDIGQ